MSSFNLGKTFRNKLWNVYRFISLKQNNGITNTSYINLWIKVDYIRP